MKASLPFLLVGILAAAAVAAQPPTHLEGDVRDLSGKDLQTVFEATRSFGGPAWLAYRVPAANDWHGGCCDHASAGHDDHGELELTRSGPHRQLSILVRLDGRQVTDLELVDPNCPFAVRGRPVFWAGNLPSAASLDLLQGWLEEDSRLAEDVIVAVALHGGDEADEILVRNATRSGRTELRKQALFWLGQRSPDHGDLIYEMAMSDESLDVAQHAIFVLAQIREPLGVEYLARAIDQQRRPEVRKDALFWIGQSDSDQAWEILRRVLNE